MNPVETSSAGFHLSPDEFDRLAALLEKHAGLHFSADKQKELEQKLIQRVPLAKKKTGGDFVSALETDSVELQDVVNGLTIGESYFFRNKPHFDALKLQIFPKLIEEARDKRKLRIWCAGCATGEEPYSIAILLREQFPETSNWDVSITATDINTSFLARAEEGVYTKWSFRGVDESIIFKYFAKEDENKYRLHADVRRTVNFKRYNLADLCESKYVSPEKFDLVICRNVLIYFSFESANQVISKFNDVTRPGSYLVVGHSEAFPALSLFDVVYSNATYYYKYRGTVSRTSDRKSLTHGPAPALSIPGIGVRTIIPKSPKPMPFPEIEASNSKMNGLSGQSTKQLSKSSFIRANKKPINLTDELERARVQVNEGKINQTLDRLSGLAAGAGKLDYRIHFLKSIVSDQAGNAQDTIQSLKQSIFLNKNFVIGHFYLGVIHEREGDLKSSSRFFRNALTLVSKLPTDHLLDEAEGLSAGRLKEIVEARFSEIRLQSD